jgi:hypothetical protein
MALVVEDGTGKSDAESFASVTEANTYWTNRGNSAWAANDAAKEVALRKAADYLEQKYRGLWLGSRVLATQALSWPRIGVTVDGFPVPPTLVPMEVKRSAIELALRAVDGELLPDAISSSGDVIREKLGEMEVEYSAGTNTGGGDPVYAAATKWLSLFLSNGGSSVIFNANVLRA